MIKASEAEKMTKQGKVQATAYFLNNVSALVEEKAKQGLKSFSIKIPDSVIQDEVESVVKAAGYRYKLRTVDNEETGTYLDIHWKA